MMLKFTRTAVALCWILGTVLVPAIRAETKVDASSGKAGGDPILQAMSIELERCKSALKLDPLPAPYFIEYRVFDMDNYAAEAAFGALRTEVRARFRFLRVVVRIGDYKQDSYYGQGKGSVDIVPLDDDVLALRHQIWDATDKAYKAAAQALTEKQARLKQLTAPDQPVDDFAHAEPVQSIEPLAKLDFDRAAWLPRIENASAIYKEDPLLQSADSAVRFSAINRYLINSEGTVIRTGYNLFEGSIAESTQAPDGMNLERGYSYTVNNLKDLPSAADFRLQATTLDNTLKSLRDAPLVEEEYRGPVLFSANAAATVFSDILGDHLLGLKPELGKNARTTGDFAASYKTRVLPDLLSVIDDPTLSSLSGQPLLGHYAIDDEGVKASRVSVIENGKLVNYLLGREPIRDFPVSNGHGRARIPTNPAGPSLSNLIISASPASTPADLKQKLIDLCRERDLPYGYYAETLGPQKSPRLLYKVWVKDGHQELVRGGTFGDLDTRALRGNIVAAGNDVYIENHALNIPHSIVTPSILFDELEIKRSNANKDKLPEYPAPPLISSK
jgi:predicted Zn-dependent protease